MKNKLHKNNISGHAELGSASHSVCHSLVVSINKIPTFQISKFPNFQIFSFFFLLCSFFSNAQPYNWQWAMKGGGNNGGIDTEQIHDIKVGADGNYYFIATIEGNSNTQLNGQPQTVYNSGSGTDIFLFSTTCDGTVRWSQAIGGEHSDRAYNLVLDSNNNVYVGAYVTGGSSYNIHFSPDVADDITPYPANMDAHKRIYLVKYDNNGNFVAKKALQGTVSGSSDREAQILDLVMDSQNKLHFIVALLNGTHLDNQVTVPSQYVYDPSTWTYNFQYRLVQYDTNLDYVNSIVLPISSASVFESVKTRFAYDETLNRYYIVGEVQNSAQIVYDGKANVNKSFILAFNGINSTTGVDGEELWRRELYSNPLNNQLANNRFTSLEIDTNSDVYIGGNLFIHPNDQNVKFYDPTNTSVQPYLFTPGADYTIPMIARLNSSGTVQWVQATEDYSVGAPAPGPRRAKGIAINGSEVALATQGASEFWDTIEIVRPLTGFQPDPVLIRFNKQTGNVIAVHEIYGDSGSSQSMTALATDSDGNYITGGTFQANLFMNNTLGITPLVSTGQADFFVAKLGATPCGTPVSTEKFNKLNVNLYPNPTTDKVTIETQETLHNYEVYNVLGQQIQKGMFGDNNQINLHGATAGTYFIKVTTNQGSTATVKVIKK